MPLAPVGSVPNWLHRPRRVTVSSPLVTPTILQPIDRVRETANATGTDDLLLLGPQLTYQPVSQSCAGGTSVSYTAVGLTSSDWESGVGVYNNARNSIIRRQVEASSNNAQPVNMSGSYDVFITILASQSKVEPALPDFVKPILIARWSARRSTIIRSSVDSAITQVLDYGGGGYNSDIMTGSARPTYHPRAFNRGYPGIFFDGSNHRLTFPTIPHFGSPFNATIIFVIQNFSTNKGTGNKHWYNWSGNPIGFLGSGPALILFNGSTVVDSVTYSMTTVDVQPDMLNIPIVIQHVYNDGNPNGIDLTNSTSRINGQEFNGSPGSVGSGSTGPFTIGSSSTSTDFGYFLMYEAMLLGRALNKNERIAMDQYYVQDADIPILGL